MIHGSIFLVPLLKASKISTARIVNRAVSSMIRKQDPQNYAIEPRPVNMDDLVEPYGDWKTAYDREKKLGNYYLARGAICFVISCVIFYKSGVIDGLWMPNLDNIIADTEPHKKRVNKEGRITV